MGRHGLLQVNAGYYIYVGSAFGPGGVRARVLRHTRPKTARHWHIDYLLDVATPIEVWCGYGVRELEHRWAKALSGLSSILPVPAFGCSDCDCETHLFSSPCMFDLDCFAQVAGGSIASFALCAGII
ncbi:MAG TPA: GIY-YIG nuclease family protein [Burkholderiales bacterium]|nr:GIY-YIG nuclease family protein [Burkholderiales bacterium]